MYNMSVIHIGFYNPPAFRDDHTFWLPYNELIARSALSHFIAGGQVLFNSAESLTDSQLAQLDVLLHSAYVWNWNKVNRLAQKFKTINPRGLNVIGGPHIDIQDNDFFTRHPWFDLITRSEMESALPSLVEHFLKDNRLQIPGFRSPTHNITKSLKEDDWHMGRGCYLENQDYIKEMIAKKKTDKQKIYVVWETIRGCPYTCTFCDWGGYTASRLRAKPMDLIKQEINFFSQIGVHQINCIDANFGIIGRDKKIVDLIGKAKKDSSYPKTFTWVPTKSSMKSIINIAERSNHHGLDEKVTRVDLQTTDQKILENVGRSNITTESLTQAITQLKTINNVGTGLIMGLPGETLSSFKNTIFDCIEMGIHEDFEIYNFSLLPNSPSNHPTYRNRFKLKTIRTIMHTESLANPENMDLAEEEIVVSTYSYQPSDWAQFYLWKCFMESLHKLGLARIIMLNEADMRRAYNITYEQLFQTDFGLLYQFLKQHLLEFAQGKKRHNKIYWKGVGFLDPEDWLFLKWASNYEHFLGCVATIMNPDPLVLKRQGTLFRRPEAWKTPEKINTLTSHSTNVTNQPDLPKVDLKSYILQVKRRLYRKEDSNVLISGVV
jgi:radical SAM superfamily enzyme YgiQ (UPF0313 family)